MVLRNSSVLIGFSISERATGTPDGWTFSWLTMGIDDSGLVIAERVENNKQPD